MVFVFVRLGENRLVTVGDLEETVVRDHGLEARPILTVMLGFFGAKDDRRRWGWENLRCGAREMADAMAFV